VSDSEPGRPPGERQELPTWTRSKSKRKSNAKVEAEGDAFTRGLRGAGQAARNRVPLVGGVLVAVAALAAGWVWWQDSQTESRVTSSRALANAAAWQARATKVNAAEIEKDWVPPNPIYVEDAQRTAEFEKGLATLDQTGDEDVKRAGDVLKASAAMRAGDYDKALGLYEAFIKEVANDHPLAWLAKEGRGLALEAKGDLDGALTNFEGMAGSSQRFYRDMAMWHQGRILERLDRKPEALAVYKQYLTEFPPADLSLRLSEVNQRVAALEAETSAAPPSPPAEPETPSPATGDGVAPADAAPADG
jgi:tetratricopeptide (TPR) repeat protein